MKKSLKSSLSLLAVLIASLFTISCGPSKKQPAPEIEAVLVDGTLFKLSEQKGQFVLLHFWGSWCAPCLRENPEMVKLYEEYGDRVSFVSVALEKDDRFWEKAVARAGIDWKNQIVSKSSVIMANEHALAYGVTEIPATFLIDAEGRLVSKFDLEQIPEVLNAMLNEG